MVRWHMKFLRAISISFLGCGQMADSPIRSDDASQVLEALTRCLEDLTPELRKAATHVLENSSLISVSSIREMAQRADVSPNTLVRMARAVGFERYEDFRRPFRDKVINGDDPFPERASWLKSLSKGGKLSELYTGMATASINNIERLFSETNARAIKGAADDIVKAQMTYVLGVGIFNAMAMNFTHLAGIALGSVIAIPRDGLSPIEGIARAEKRDVLLAMAFRPYRRDVVQAVALAVSRGVKVIGISDSPAAPIMARASHRFVVPTDPSQFFPSTVALASLLETIIAFVVAGSGPEAVTRMEELQERDDDLGINWNED